MARDATPPQGQEPVYSAAARSFHWLTVAAVLVMIPLGLYMVRRGHLTDFDTTTGQLYDLHKLLGFLTLILVVSRLSYRFGKGAPPDEPTLEWWQRVAAHLTHWSLYGLLLAMPLLGWLGVSLYGARGIFGLVSLPPLASQNQDMAAKVFFVHFLVAMVLVLMIGAHIGAAMFHHFIRKDGVLRRMLPGLSRR